MALFKNQYISTAYKQLASPSTHQYIRSPSALKERQEMKQERNSHLIIACWAEFEAVQEDPQASL